MLKASEISSAGILGPKGVNHQTIADVKIEGVSFKQWLEKSGNADLLGGDLFKQLNAAQQGLIARTELSPRELLNYQILAGQFGLRVELVSKIGESLMSTARKFQTNQG